MWRNGKAGSNARPWNIPTNCGKRQRKTTHPTTAARPRGGGKDSFGVTWVTPDSGGGTALPEPGNFLLDEETICDWRSIIKFPDVSAYHWEADAKEQLYSVDRTVTAVDYGDGNGPFERLAAFMGFENALISIAMEPEAVEGLLTAITDYKLKALDYIAKY